MLSLRSLAFILASAIRRARALSCAALQRSPDRTSIRITGTKTATKIAIKMAASSMLGLRITYSFEGRTAGRYIPALSSPKYNQRRFRGLRTGRRPATLDRRHSSSGAFPTGQFSLANLSASAGIFVATFLFLCFRDDGRNFQMASGGIDRDKGEIGRTHLPLFVREIVLHPDGNANLHRSREHTVYG